MQKDRFIQQKLLSPHSGWITITSYLNKIEADNQIYYYTRIYQHLEFRVLKKNYNK